jgi:hypothetical protein
MSSKRPAALVSALFALMATALLTASLPVLAQKAGTRPAPAPTMVDCLLPGQIRHGANGVPMMGPRRKVSLTATDCQLRGGEYVVAVVPKPAPVVAVAPAARKPEELVVVRCLLPEQIRQLGTKVTYVKVQRPTRIARWQCQKRGGQSVTLARYQEAEKVYIAAVAKSKPTPKPVASRP